MSSKFNTLKQRNITLSQEISNATEFDNHDDAIKLKKELYSNKLEMLNLLTQEDRRAGLTAFDLRTKVDAMESIPRYSTGIAALDRQEAFNGGIEVGSLVLFGGASGTGKSKLTLEIICNVASHSRAVFFNLEMGERRIVKRLGDQLTNDKQWDNHCQNHFCPESS